MKKVGYSEPVPCDVHDLTDEQAREYCLVENMDREDLNPIEEAHGFAQNITVNYDGDLKNYESYIKAVNVHDVRIESPSNDHPEVKDLAAKIELSAGEQTTDPITPVAPAVRYLVRSCEHFP